MINGELFPTSFIEMGGGNASKITFALFLCFFVASGGRLFSLPKSQQKASKNHPPFDFCTLEVNEIFPAQYGKLVVSFILNY